MMHDLFNLSQTTEGSNLMTLTLYLIQATRGVNPDLYENKSLGFVKASSKAKAIAQALHSVSYSYDRLQALTESQVGLPAWEIEQELFPMLQRYCEHVGCDNKLRKTNSTGYCKDHIEQATHRKQRKPYEYR